MSYHYKYKIMSINNFEKILSKCYAENRNRLVEFGFWSNKDEYFSVFFPLNATEFLDTLRGTAF